jgi:polyketide biosynthesis acyl carrier protein
VNSDAVFQIILSNVREVVPELDGHPFQRADQLKELGVGSLERTEIVVMTLEAVGLNIPIVQMYGPQNLGELADLIAIKVSASMVLASTLQRGA